LDGQGSVRVLGSLLSVKHRIESSTGTIGSSMSYTMAASLPASLSLGEIARDYPVISFHFENEMLEAFPFL